MKQFIIAVCLLVTTVATAQSTTIKVYGNCGMCEDRIEQAALSVIGVSAASWSAETEELTIDHAPFFVVAELHQKMISVGHDTDQLRADDTVYKDLHGCCKYDRPDQEGTPTGEAPTDTPNSPKDLITSGHDDHDHTGEVAGMIFEETAAGKLQPLIGATVGWYDNAAGTFTDQDGHWSLAAKGGDQRIVVSYVGYEADTIDMADQQLVAITLRSNHVLEAVEIKYRKRSTEISFIDPIKSQRITQKELCKAACCNLSESFETTPAVDVATTDAVTGTRKIQMLGLAGPNIQIMRENMPYIRGLAALVGMEYTPGPWIESIQLNLGTGSVVNGPESITGQINVETKKPLESEKFYLNLFGNLAGRLEANINTTQAVNDKWSTATLFHAKTLQQENDRNNDNFLDIPNATHLIGTHRWRYRGDNGLMGQIGIKGCRTAVTGGGLPSNEASEWTSQLNSDRVDLWTKVGKVFPNRPYASVGFQLSGTYHDQQADYGRGTDFGRSFNGIHRNLYANLIYQTIIGNTDHKIKTGSSFVLDDMSETIGLATFERNEVMPGAFVEYQYAGSDKVSIVAGLRGDYHNLFGAFLTPRLHVKYSPTDRQALRLAIGRGQRTQSIFAENIGLFASNRTIAIQPSDANNPYGLVPDIGWNLGLNYTVEGTLANIPVIWGIDYYYTVFTSQVVADYETSATVRFYALDGQSRAHSVQTQVDITPAKGLDLRLAYRYNDPRTQYKSGLLLNPLIAQHRAFANVAYETENGWMFDLTANWIGRKRLPNTSISPEQYQLADYSPDYRLLNGQITKRFGETLDIYVGGENILNFRQENPIVAVDNVTSPYFDASMIWGPILGGNAYVGIRYRIL